MFPCAVCRYNLEHLRQGWPNSTHKEPHNSLRTGLGPHVFIQIWKGVGDCKKWDLTATVQYVLLTPWSSVLLEKLAGSQLVKKFQAVCGTQRFITAFTSACRLSITPGPRPIWMIHNMIRVYGEEFLAPRPTPKLEDHLLLAVFYCLLHIFAATLHNGGRFSIRNLRDSLITVQFSILLWIRPKSPPDDHAIVSKQVAVWILYKVVFRWLFVCVLFCSSTLRDAFF
jgi:hypothetical protein